MIIHYMKRAISETLQNSFYSLINIGGLALGLAAFLLIMTYLQFETNFDNFIPDGEQIYRVEIDYQNANGTSIQSSAGPVSAKSVFVQEFSNEVDVATTFYHNQDTEIRIGDKLVLEDIIVADQDFFKVFDLPFVQGDGRSAFSNANSVVLTQSMATKYFEGENPVGKRLNDYLITAIIEDLPENSHLPLGIIAGVNHNSRDFFPDVANRWDLNFMYSYIKFKPEANLELVRGEFDNLIRKYLGPDAARVGFDPNEWGQLRMVALHDIHFEPTTLAPLKPHGNHEQNYIFFVVSLLVLSIAIINFVNLATARATRRAKEVSIRKVLGASRRQLIIQYMTEAIFLTFVAAFLSLVLVELSTPWLQAIIDNGMPPMDFTKASNLAVLGTLVLAIGATAGLYPAFVLSSYRPSRNLSIGRTESASSIKMRQFLVIVQFTASIILIISTIVVYQQTIFARSVDLGFNKGGVISLTQMGGDDVFPLVESFKTELMRNSNTVALTNSTYTPGDGSEGNLFVTLPDNPNGENILLSWQNMSYDYYKTMGITPLAGRVFSRDIPADEMMPRDQPDFATGNIVLNLAAVHHLGFESAEAAIGTEILVGDNGLAVVVGVVPDVRYRSIREAIRPSIHLLDNGPLNAVLIRYETANTEAYVEFLQNTWDRFFPGKIMRMEYVDQKIDQLYGNEDRWSYVLLSFSMLAIMISSLGLLGLAVLTVENRVKEIGIRKVFGARVSQIVKLFLWQFTKPVIVANFVAWPIAWLSMTNWLNEFAYRIDLMIWPFLIAASFALLLAWFTVGTQAYKVALLNPIKALRYE